MLQSAMNHWRGALLTFACAAALAVACGDDDRGGPVDANCEDGHCECSGNECICPSTGDCDIDCLGDCDLECAGSGDCTFACGDGCAARCTNSGNCHVEVGDGGTVECTANGDCHITCLAQCSVWCTGSGECNVTCDDGSTPIECGGSEIACGSCSPA